ncbi:hypothetical protein D3C87_1893770 [compost metagenome]
MTLSGGLNQTVQLGELQWTKVGPLPADTVLTIDATQPVAVLSADSREGNYFLEVGYTLIPY